MRTIFWLAGGLSVGLGMVTVAAYGFNQPGGEVSASFSQFGFDALPSLTITTSGVVGLFLVALGAVLMIKANATAWKQTGGY
jgi:hypothetical protein